MGAPRAQRGVAPTDSRAGGELAVNDGIKLLLCYKKSVSYTHLTLPTKA